MSITTQVLFFLMLFFFAPALLKGQQDSRFFSFIIDSLAENDRLDAAIEATAQWKRHLEEHPNVVDSVWQSFTMMNLNRLKYNTTKDTAYAEALAFLRETNNTFTPAYIDILSDYAFYHYQKGQYAQAVKIMEEAVQHAGDFLNETDILLLKKKNELGFLMIITGKPDEGGVLIESVLHAAREQGLTHTNLYLYSLQMRGKYLGDTGRFEKSWATFREALELAERLFGKESKKYWEVLFSYCTSLISADNFEEVLPLLEEEKQLNDRLFGNTTSSDRMISVQLRGTVLSNMKRYEECIATYEEGKKVAEVTAGKNSQQYAVCHYYIGLANDGLRRFEQADSAFTTAIQIMTERAKGVINLYLALFKLGRAQMLVRWGHYEESTRELTEIEAFFESQKSSLYYYYFQQAKADMLFARGQLTEGIQMCDSVIVSSREKYGLHSDIEVTFQEKKMDQYYNAGQFEAALEPLEAFSETIKNNYVYKYPFLSDAQRYNMFQEYNKAIRLLACIQMQNPQINTTASLLNKQLFSKNFQEHTSRRILNFVKNMRDEEVMDTYSEWQLQYTALADMYQMSPRQLEEEGLSLAEKEKEVLAIESKLVQKGIPALKKLKSPEWQDIAATLRPGEAAMDVIRFQPVEGLQTSTKEIVYACFIITPHCEKPEIVFFKNGAEIESVFWGRYASEISARKEISNDLFADFWAKLSPLLAGVNTLYYSPDGIFHKINLGTLRTPDGHYLIENMTLAPVTTLRHLTERNSGVFPASGTIVLAGNPDYQTPGPKSSPAPSDVPETYRELLEDGDPLLHSLPRLPGSEREVKRIAAKAQQAHWTSTIFTGEQATETAIKQVSHPTILHLATHGYFMKDERRSQEVAQLTNYVQRNPALRSMLFFSGAGLALQGQPTEGDDGILTAFEAAVLPLDNSELVVLSACNTGLGKVQNGEGVIGLQRAFRMAGARSLVMTLWEVEDSATELFMDKFYEGIFSGKPKTDAFREAQLFLKSKYPQPFFWGAFVMVNG